MMTRLKVLLAMTIALIVAIGVVERAHADEESCHEWTEFAKTSGNPRDVEWATLVCDPEAIALDKGWTGWRGYNATQLIKKAREEGKIPPDVKPGLVITAANVDSIQGLKELLPFNTYERLKSEWAPYKKIRVVPTSHYYLSRNRLEGTKREKGEFYLDELGGLRIKNCSTCGTPGDHWGLKSQALPFNGKPKNGLEAFWLFMAHDVGADALFSKPMDFILCDSANKLERTYSAHLWWMRFHGRVDWEPIPEFKGMDDVFQGGAVFFLHPFDVKGLAGVRLRYFDTAKDDSFVVFIPSLKRTRVLTGTDTQDPLIAGGDLTWDEWRGYWQKIDPRVAEYNLVGEGFILAEADTGFVGHGYTFKDCQFDTIDMELRPVWIIEQVDKTGQYQYKLRKLWIDKELYYLQHQEMYDKRGSRWRAWEDQKYIDPRTGFALWRNVIIADVINHHLTVVHLTLSEEESRTGTKLQYFNIDSLRTYK